jgi:hypothetical protein
MCEAECRPAVHQAEWLIDKVFSGTKFNEQTQQFRRHQRTIAAGADGGQPMPTHGSILGRHLHRCVRRHPWFGRSRGGRDDHAAFVFRPFVALAKL